MPASAGGWTLTGVSRAADATAFFIPELGWALDAGAKVCEQFPKHIFITHTHSDHACKITHLKSRRVCPELYCPIESSGLLEAYIVAAQAMTWNREITDPEAMIEPAYTMRATSPGEVFEISHGKERIDVEVVRCDHSVACVGYSFWRSRRKLKEEYRGLPGAELGKLRASGVEIDAWQRKPMFAFLGDTTPKVFEDHPELLDQAVVICECTFLDEPERAAQTGHTTLDELAPIIASAPETTFVLIHLSHRHEPEELVEQLEQRGLSNALVWGQAPIDEA